MQHSRLCQQLLHWWEQHRLRRIEQKPWMFTPDGRWPGLAEPLEPLAIWVAENVRIQYAYFADPANPDYKAPYNQLLNIPRVYTTAGAPYSWVGLDLAGNRSCSPCPRSSRSATGASS